MRELGVVLSGGGVLLQGLSFWVLEFCWSFVGVLLAHKGFFWSIGSFVLTGDGPSSI